MDAQSWRWLNSRSIGLHLALAARGNVVAPLESVARSPWAIDGAIKSTTVSKAPIQLEATAQDWKA